MDPNLKIVTLFQNGKTSDVIRYYNNTSPDIAPNVQYIVGISYLFEGEYENAKHQLFQLKKASSNLPDYCNYYALALIKCGEYQKANNWVKKDKQKQSILHFEVGIECAMKCGQIKRAARLVNEAKKNGCLSLAIEINHAIILLYQGKLKMAESLLMTLFSKAPNNMVVCDNLIRLYISMRKSQKSELLINAYLEHDPENLPYLWKLVDIYSAQGNKKKMKMALDRVIKADKSNASYLRATMAISSVYSSTEDMIKERGAIMQALDRAIKLNDYPNAPEQTYGCTPFYLTYQGENNKDFLYKISEVFKKGLPKVPKIKKTITRKKHPKIAIVSQHFYEQSVMDFYCHTLVNIPKDFHVTLINISPLYIDRVTKILYERADQVFQPSTNHSELVSLILDGDYDAIIYPEIGMSPTIYYLAMQRLAALQLVIIGHPETSGMSSIDYYISWKCFHSKNANDQFVETLVQLNNIPICYDYPKGIDNVKKSLRDLGLNRRPGMRLFSIPVMLFKIQCEFDEVIERIVKASPDHIILMVSYNKIEAIIIERLRKRLTDKELTQVWFEPPFKKRDYYALLKNSHVFLEPFPFGGGNTVLQAMAAGTPVISLQTNRLKGSFGTGFYKWIKCTEFIANSIDEYVDIAIKTANDDTIKRQFKQRIQDNKYRLYGNMSGSHEFYDWLRKKLMPLPA